MNRNIAHARAGLQAAHVHATERVQTAPNVPVNLVEDAMAAFDLLEVIQIALSGTEWDAGTPAEIAEAMRSYGFEIENFDG